MKWQTFLFYFTSVKYYFCRPRCAVADVELREPHCVALPPQNPLPLLALPASLLAPPRHDLCAFILFFAAICVGGEIFAGILLGPNIGSPPAAVHFLKGASKAVTKVEALSEAKAHKWRDHRLQKTGDGDAAGEEEEAAAVEEEDAVATLGADVEDLKEARDAVAATLPARWFARACRAYPADDKENDSGRRGGAP